MVTFGENRFCGRLNTDKGIKTDLEEVKLIYRGICWFERIKEGKEVIWVREEKLSLTCSVGVGMKLSHTWDRKIRTLPYKLMSSSTSGSSHSGNNPSQGLQH